MSDFLGAIPALIGVVVGIGATSWADHARWKRGQAVRWDERRIEAYAEYAKAIKKIHMTSLRIVRSERPDDLTKPIDPGAALEILTLAEAQRTEAWELIMLLSDPATAHAALRWNYVVRREAEFARTRPDAKSADWIALVKSVDQARDSFYEAARNSVNVGGGSVAVAELIRTMRRARVHSKQPAEPADL
jgi:hypothetical protein